MIEVRDLQFSYRLKDGGHLQALKGISLQIGEGESVSVIGSNGSGKSTLALCLNGLLIPQTGRVLVDGLDVRQHSSLQEIRRRVGMVFQNPDNQIISTTVEREIAFGLENLAFPAELLRERVEEVLEQFHLVELRHRPPHLLSGGEKQRLSIAAVLAMSPKYLILDEPTSLLDPISRVEVQQLLRRLGAQGNVTLIHITQFPEEAAEAQRVLVLHRGELVAQGGPQEIFAQDERLANLGLRPPFAMALAGKLHRAGIVLSDPIQDMEDLANKLVGRLGVAPLSQKKGDKQREVARLQEPVSSKADGERIRTEMLCYRYNPGLPTERIALQGVDLSIRRGELVGLVGPIGSGKSTLVQHLNALLRPTSGRVLVDGESVGEQRGDLRDLRRKVGLVFQFPEKQLFEETVYDDVAFGPRNLKLSQEEVDSRVLQALGLVGLDADQYSSRSPFDLSGGEQRRVAIAGVLALQPEILILDEPFVGLDPRGCEKILNILRLLRQRGVTIVLITHHMDLVAPLADRLVAMKEGAVAADDSPGAIFATADRTEDLGIDLPQAAWLTLRLRQLGWQIDAPALTMEQALEAILGQLRG